jgi:AraC-like DNA-binding protein
MNERPPPAADGAESLREASADDCPARSGPGGKAPQAASADELPATAASGYVALLLGVGATCYGIPRGQMLSAALLTEQELADPDARVPEQALWALMRFLRAESGDPGLGLRMADALDLRAQGYWGYALLSSMTLRERMGIHVRYSKGRSSIPIEMRVEGDLAIVDFDVSHLDRDLIPMVCDWGATTACLQHRRHMAPEPSGITLWLTYPEQPHHREMRERLTGVVFVFDAPSNRFSFPARDLDRQLPGDPHLGKLAVKQLETNLESQRIEERSSTGPALVQMVRARLIARLSDDASLERIARDLRVSARTLRRRLGALGTSFQELLDDVRRARAIEYLVASELAVEQISTQLGYGDPANFRRAFRRWEGLAPSAYRAQKRVSVAE